ncbi:MULTISPECIES: PaaI family thioesterase [Pseudomonas]|uniref:PaaI family thioesterase n=2 Tax=Pseudomonas nitroreducens/multiresinivorans group TaxID=627141 RepID=A0A6G6IWQ7_PSENT|nr:MULTISPECIES: PaaI family thioesterase [Pseudomonas]MBG6288704.1 PaaI family thioesterase [Pseudomonas nitroreducens]MCE4070825.1 PaaI family thioesterase [Pseudomonas nitritireducens]MCE4080305.1 PaaI family thioesterase [Pseudomonas nitroreducens]MDG9855123.1 PaaI family thioesterase [Pseudomonas nitroreducens]MDH1074036.1 PaaI family thioesterase [Pseudomonas nitroreducens]
MTTVNIEAMVRAAHESKDYDPLIDAIPYARLLGIRCLRLGDDAIFHLPANPDNIGNPTLPALHGGVIAGFMEHSALLHLLMFMGIPHMPKIIDFSIDYLRAGHFRDTYAQCQVWRQGRRVANVAITAWQTTRTEPIATARAHFKVDGA